MKKSPKITVKGKSKPVNWSAALKKALETERDRDALKAVDLIRELYWLVVIKHNNKK